MYSIAVAINCNTASSRDSSRGITEKGAIRVMEIFIALAIFGGAWMLSDSIDGLARAVSGEPERQPESEEEEEEEE